MKRALGWRKAALAPYLTSSLPPGNEEYPLPPLYFKERQLIEHELVEEALQTHQAVPAVIVEAVFGPCTGVHCQVVDSQPYLWQGSMCVRE